MLILFTNGAKNLSTFKKTFSCRLRGKEIWNKTFNQLNNNNNVHWIKRLLRKWKKVEWTKTPWFKLNCFRIYFYNEWMSNYFQSFNDIQKMRYLLICKKISGKCRKIYWEVCGILKLTCRAYSFFSHSFNRESHEWHEAEHSFSREKNLSAAQKNQHEKLFWHLMNLFQKNILKCETRKLNFLFPQFFREII